MGSYRQFLGSQVTIVSIGVYVQTTPSVLDSVRTGGDLNIEHRLSRLVPPGTKTNGFKDATKQDETSFREG